MKFGIQGRRQENVGCRSTVDMVSNSGIWIGMPNSVAPLLRDWGGLNTVRDAPR